MLNRVEIKEFRSCHDVVLDDLTPVTVLVGRNAVGKTNILRAIEWLATSATTTTVTAPLPRQRVAARSRVGDSVYDYSLDADARSQGHLFIGEPLVAEFLKCSDGGRGEQTVFERRGERVALTSPDRELMIGKSASCMSALPSILPVESPIVRSILPLRLALKGVRYHGIDPSDDDGPLVGQRDYDSWLVQYLGGGSPPASVHRRLLHLYLTDEFRFREIADLLGVNGLGVVDDVRVHHFGAKDGVEPIPTQENFYLITFRPSMLSASFPDFFGFKSLSAGTQRVIRIIVSLIFDESSVMLLEHPEDDIHPGLLRKLIGVLQSYSDKTQLIIATHSPVVLNAFEPAAVRLVTMEDGATKVRPLTPGELDAAAHFLEDEGSFSDFLETVGEG